jgi:Bacterial Ig domain/FG-GAP-like repeat
MRHQKQSSFDATNTGCVPRRRRTRRAGLMAGAATLAVALALPAGALAQPSFDDPANYAVGDQPLSVATGDFNGDALPDMAVTNTLGDSVSVLLGKGGGSFDTATKTDYPVGNNPYYVAVGDVDNVADANGDKHPDLVVASWANSSSTDDIQVLHGKGDGTFEAAAKVDIDEATFVALSDFDHTNGLDIAATSWHASVALNKGDGTFDAPKSYATGEVGPDGNTPAPWSIAVRDLNHDDNSDLVLANYDAQNIGVLLGKRDGTFGPAATYKADGGPSDVAVADFNGDSHPDLAVANYQSANVSVLPGDGTGAFGAATHYDTGRGATSSANNDGTASVAVGDFDDDAHLDPAVANYAAGNLSVLAGKGDGTFGAATNLTAGNGPTWVTAADFNGDRRDDLAVANWNGDNVSVLLNHTNRAPVAVADAYSVDASTQLKVDAPGLLANDSDPEADTLTAIRVNVVPGPNHGELALNSDGSFTYTSDSGYLGEDYFHYKVSDGKLESSTVKVAITVKQPSPPPA